MTALLLPFGAALVSIVSAAVVARGLVTEVAPLVIGTTAIEGTGVSAQVSGGTDGERYLITVRAIIAGGAVQEREIEVGVVDLSWAVPTIANPYLSAAGFVQRLGLDDAIAITATSDGSRIDAARLQLAIDDAQGEAEGALAARYATPLSPVPPIIVTIIFDIAVARLWRADLPQGVADRRDRAQQLLAQIAAGKVTIPGAAALMPAETAPAPVLFQGNDRVLSRASLRGF